ncbi:signal peptidase I [Kitasatospora sp. NPDC059827]|uniref:signal peptidase I n=1 Tax=Kitasatospora sp. NPDC059827 TaxID=3346964 RepID=UPI003651CA15
MNGEAKPEDGKGSAPEPEAQEPGTEQVPAEDVPEGWWPVLRVSLCRATATMATTLMLMPLAALMWGWSPAVVVSGSMEPALSRGDVVATRHAGMREVGGGAVISFADAARGGRMTTHRAVERLEDGAAYRTKGDANHEPDPALVRAEQLKGVVAVAIPWVGSAWLWLQDGDWGASVAAVAVYALLLGGCRDGARKPGPGATPAAPAAP